MDQRVARRGASSGGRIDATENDLHEKGVRASRSASLLLALLIDRPGGGPSS